MERICNCRNPKTKDCSCKNGYECCSEKKKNGYAPVGICCKAGHCDQKRGICSSSPVVESFTTVRIPPSYKYITIGIVGILILLFLIYFLQKIYRRYFPENPNVTRDWFQV